ncbi:MAG: gliding motility protein GldN [Chitinophagaceae bacterium]|nr:gliding motility protein GldN [Chitinophagaceae bacterium]
MKSIFNKSKLILTGLLFSATFVIAQPGTQPNVPSVIDPNVNPANNNAVTENWVPSLRPEGAIDRVPHKHILSPWQPVREADVLWRKVVWREIDTRQKQNFAFRYPGDEYTGGGMYIEILMHAIKTSAITAFEDERFTTQLSMEQVYRKVVGEPDSTIVEDFEGNQTLVINNPSFNPDNITKFRVKEEWIFDRNIGRMVCRIMGIAPYIDNYKNGTFRGSLPMFWLNYQDVRKVNVNYEVYNPENDVFRITWDDFFEKRMFSSFVYKSSINNPFNTTIDSYKKGIDRMYESEKINETLFNKEHDLWTY